MYSTVVELLAGMNTNESLRHELSQRDALPQRTIRARTNVGRGTVRRSVIATMTEKGDVVFEERVTTDELGIDADDVEDEGAGAEAMSPPKPGSRSPIAELLYSRWIENLRSRWPILGM